MIAKQKIIIMFITHDILEAEKYADKYVLLAKRIVKKM